MFRTLIVLTVFSLFIFPAELIAQEKTMSAEEHKRLEELRKIGAGGLENHHPKKPVTKKGNPMDNPSEAQPTVLSVTGVDPSKIKGQETIQFAGLQLKVKSVVYLIDASGSMVEHFPHIENELKASIRGLSEQRSHQYNIVFFYLDDVIEVRDQEMKLMKGLKKASAENKMKTFKWMSEGRIIPRGISIPWPGIKHALQQGPDAIIMVSDGIRQDFMYSMSKEDLLKELKSFQDGLEGGPIPIHTISYEGKDKYGTLKAISEMSGGTHQYFTKNPEPAENKSSKVSSTQPATTQKAPATQPATPITKGDPTVPSQPRHPKKPTLSKPNPLAHPDEVDQSTVKIFGLASSAKKVIFVVDSSGSMLQGLPYVQAALQASLGELGPKHQFNVIYFNRFRAIEVADEEKGLAAGLKVASADNKAKASQFINTSNDIVPRGSSDPTPAMVMAIKQNPDVIYLISDMESTIRNLGFKKELFESIKKAQAEVKKEHGRTVKINAIQLFNIDEGKTLEQITKDHGGQIKFVSKKDVGLE